MKLEKKSFGSGDLYSQTYFSGPAGASDSRT